MNEKSLHTTHLKARLGQQDNAVLQTLDAQQNAQTHMNTSGGQGLVREQVSTITLPVLHDKNAH
jgi:hypothetical protein